MPEVKGRRRKSADSVFLCNGRGSSGSYYVIDAVSMATRKLRRALGSSSAQEGESLRAVVAVPERMI